MKMKHLHRIRALREDLDLTQTDAASLPRIEQTAYSNYELGRTRILPDRMLVLAKYYISHRSQPR